MRVYPTGIVRTDGGTTFVCEGTPNSGIQWTLTGPGTLTPTMPYTDVNGVATAVYMATGSAAYDQINVRAECYA